MISPIRILMICPQFKPIVGGYERAAERLSTELVRQGYEVTILTERRDLTWEKKEVINGIYVRRLWCIYWPRWHAFTSMLSFGSFLLLNSWRYQIFHVHQYGYHAALAVILGRLMHRPVVLKLTSTAEYGLSKAFLHQNPLSQKIIMFLHRHVDACITTSRTGAEEALEFGIPKKKIYLIGNGVDINEFVSFSDRSKKDIKAKLAVKSELMILYVGRLSPEKNSKGLLEAWNKIKGDFPNAKLVFIGSGPENNLLKENIVSLDCMDSVKMVGQIGDVLKWYQAADIYVLPSYNEGLSNSLLEAMSCSLPVVSTRVSGSAEIFEQSNIGKLVEVGDVEGLAAGIRTLLEDKKNRIKCGINARVFVERFYSIAIVTSRVTEVYRSLLS